MKTIDRIVIACMVYFALYLCFLHWIGEKILCAVLALISCIYLCHAAALLSKKRTYHRRRDILQTARLHIASLSLMDTQKALMQIDALFQAEFSPGTARFFAGGILYSEKDAWISVSLRHPESDRPGAQELVRVIRQKNRRGTEHCALVCLGQRPATPADPELSCVSIFDGDALTALYCRHPALLPAATTTRSARKGIRTYMAAFLQPPSKKRVLSHICYALFMLPGWLLSKSLLLLLCMIFHITYALYGIFSRARPPFSSPFGDICR